MDIKNKATRIDLFNFSSPQMRAFHMSWFAFFLCFFAWFGIAPLLKVVAGELQMDKQQLKNTMIAGVAFTIFARLFVGWLCDRIGPRLCYTGLLILGSLPVMGIGFAHDYHTFLLFRIAIGLIGASFVITQYHTSVMFAPNCVGTANATSAGWGNLGGGVTQMVMPLVLAGVLTLGVGDYWGWRISMIIAGGVCFLTGIAYFFLTTDLPDGNFKELRERGELRKAEKVKGTFAMACKDSRVWALFVVYGGCFGIELFINGMAALYFASENYFDLDIKTAGLIAGLFGLMNLFARTTGGIIGDKFAKKGGLKGRVRWLFMALFFEGIFLMVFSRFSTPDLLPVAIGTLVMFSLFTQMSEGATYSVVPFVNKKAVGSVAGIVGAGGNMGAVIAGFCFKEFDSTPEFLLYLGGAVILVSFCSLLVRFSPAAESEAKVEFEKALEERRVIADAERARRGLPERVPTPAFTFSNVLKGTKAIDIIRIYLGGALIVQGIYFIMNFSTLTAQIGHFQNVLAWYVVAAHVVGGACLMVGFATRTSAFFNLTVILGAIFSVHLKNGLFSDSQGLELTLFAAVTLMALIWTGPGRLSFDDYMKTT